MTLARLGVAAGNRAPAKAAAGLPHSIGSRLCPKSTGKPLSNAQNLHFRPVASPELSLQNRVLQGDPGIAIFEKNH
jgi:hypothetical protein